MNQKLRVIIVSHGVKKVHLDNYTCIFDILYILLNIGSIEH